MNYPNLFIVTAAVALAACSEPEPSKDAAPATGTTRVALQREGSAPVSVYAFRQQGEAFLYDTLFREGWTADGTLHVRMRNGSYKFLFASGADNNLVLTPVPDRTTAWEEVAFTLQKDASSSGTYLPSDELFLQYPASDAGRVYEIRGTDVAVKARLTRAVCRIGVALKRGYRDADGYIEVPYAKPHSVLDEIDRIEITTDGTGLSVRPDAVAGKAAVHTVLAAADYAELTDEGFVLLDGPFVLPPAVGDEIGLAISVVPKAGAALEPKQLSLKGSAVRNKRLDVTLWITSGYPEIGVEIRTTPIDREQDGDTGIWE